MGGNQQKRLAAETDEKSDTRLQRLRAYQQNRLAAETDDDRETRLQTLLTSNTDWLQKQMMTGRPDDYKR